MLGRPENLGGKAAHISFLNSPEGQSHGKAEFRTSAIAQTNLQVYPVTHGTQRSQTCDPPVPGGKLGLHLSQQGTAQ
jgi:hypothetical protein